VLDRHGRAVGVVTWTWREQGGGYAIPIADATRMLAERPKLEDEADRKARAELRTRLFLDAVARADGETARRYTSPSQARKHREEAMDRILADSQDGEGLAIMQSFVAALDEVVDDVREVDDPALAGEALGSLVLGVATSDVRRSLGRGLPMDQVVSFFHELGDAYLRARVFGGEDGEGAMRSALQRLRTIDAARSFALAALVTELDGRQLTVRTVELVPGAYAPGARVELEAAPGRAPAETGPGAGTGADGATEALDLHLRLEWGDFYVTSVEPTSLG
jgi:hypothetical protein